MANTNNNKAAEAAALLKQKEAELVALPETATEEEKAAALKEVNEAKELVESLNSKPKKEITVKIKFTKSPTGRFNLAYNIGEVAEFEVKQAAEIIDAEFGVYVK